LSNASLAITFPLFDRIALDTNPRTLIMPATARWNRVRVFASRRVRLVVATAGAILSGTLASLAPVAQLEAQMAPQFANVESAERAAEAMFANGDTATARRIVAVSTAYRWMQAGTRYQWGAIGQRDGIDCSALVRASLTRAGLTGVPRTSNEQARIGVAVPRAQLQMADLLLFGTSGRISHVGLYLGGGYFVHSASSQHGVVVSRLSDPLWTRLWMTTRRVIADGPTAATRDTRSTNAP
jgi:cell wall-associated NlpC family hydrolase